jgi:hypothetical protein
MALLSRISHTNNVSLISAKKNILAGFLDGHGLDDLVTGELAHRLGALTY